MSPSRKAIANVLLDSMPTLERTEPIVAVSPLLPSLPLDVLESLKYLHSSGTNKSGFLRAQEAVLEIISEKCLFDKPSIFYLLPYFAPLLPDIIFRWKSLLQSGFQSDDAPSHDTVARLVPALGRVVLLHPEMGEYAANMLTAARLTNLPQSTSTLDVLLGLLRLSEAVPSSFPLIGADSAESIFRHSPNPAARYLAIRLYCRALNLAEAAMERLMEDQVWSQVSVETGLQGDYDGCGTIDFQFIDLWEARRRKAYAGWIEQVQDSPNEGLVHSMVESLEQTVLAPGVVLLGDTLLARDISSTPESAGLSSDSPMFINTATSKSNLTRLATALKCPSSSILLAGPSGSGKTLICSHAAAALNKRQSLITLHLNEQTDPRTLIGMYSSGAESGSFEWIPGVLTTAVREGRWVVIEDFDRAPEPVVSLLLPLLERGELPIPSRDEIVKAAAGFRLFATVRTDGKDRAARIDSMVGARLWTRVYIESMPVDELGFLVSHRFPALEPHATTVRTLFTTMSELYQSKKMQTQCSSGTVRPFGTADLLKWCARVGEVVASSPVFSSAILDSMFLHAVECFADSLPAGSVRTGVVGAIATSLQIPPQRRDFLIADRVIGVQQAEQSGGIAVGRTTLTPFSSSRRSRLGRPIDLCQHTLRYLEKLCTAVRAVEPVLLVGETGIGKTATIQMLAHSVGIALDVYNMSQQSESGDLLGSFKPVTPATLLFPLMDDFQDLFSASFPAGKNGRFTEMLTRAFEKKQWKHVVKLWRASTDTYFQSVKAKTESTDKDADQDESGRPKKKRKPNGSGDQSALYARWIAFSSAVLAVEPRVTGGDSKPVFAFVEGNFTKAVSTGGWVLLDEINLASLDTLEPLLDLLSPAGSRRFVTLAESGTVSEIVAHPNFRIFAAMNPATDVGKRDLPMSIRTRFTEIYFPSPDGDRESLVSIVKSYLCGFGDLDRHLASDATDAYLAVQALSNGHHLVDGAGERPHFSLRSLTRALVYANDAVGSHPVGGYRRALADGFEMAFSTSLDSASRALVEPTIYKHLKAKNMGSDSPETIEAADQSDDPARVSIGSGYLPRGPEEGKTAESYIITRSVARNIANLVRAVSTRRYPVLLQGPTSAGKTSMIEYLAARSGNRCVRINNHEHTDLQEYLGSYVSEGQQLVFRDGALVKAMRRGDWLILDELNLAPSEILEALNRLLDDNRELLVPETQEVVRPHAGFVLFATQNPAGLYGGRKHLSRAFRNRFVELHFDDIPVNELSVILHRRAGIPESWSRKMVDVYGTLAEQRMHNRLFDSNSFVTLRDLFRWAGRGADTIEQLGANGYMLLGERVRDPEEKEVVKTAIETCLSKNGARVTIDALSLYDDLPAISQPDGPASVQTDLSTSDVVYTPAMCRLLTLVNAAFQNQEPVLLVGETGCGKTTGVQVFSTLAGQTLFTVNAHQNTEAGDLLGSQRPLRHRASTEATLRAVVSRAVELIQPGLQEDESMSLENALSFLDVHSADVPTELKATIGELLKKLSQLFEWADGPLVQAMKEGNVFLLDEISLAEDAVLERLNSVLESSRSLYLAEMADGPEGGSKSGVDRAQIAAQPGFRFVATMNPGGDYGKRELSPALRSRFTEIWVPSLTLAADIERVVGQRLFEDAAAYAPAMVSYARWFASRFGSAPGKSTGEFVSVRALLTWRDFVNQHAGHIGTVSAIIHGAAMVFIDSLGANPSGLMSSSAADVPVHRAEAVVHLAQAFGCDAEALLSGAVDVSASGSIVAIGQFGIERSGESEDCSGFDLRSPTTRMNAARILRALTLNRPILLEGSPGVGKTSLVVNLARLAGKKLARLNLSEQTDLMDLFGSDVPSTSGVGRFTWRDAPFLTAMKRGDWVLLDEMNLASQAVLEGLNACLDHRGEVFVAELGLSFKKAPGFCLFATQNPHHQGGGRKGLPASFVDRFTVVYADVLTGTDLRMIAGSMFGGNGDVSGGLSLGEINAAVEFATRLDGLLQSRAIGAVGSPWEFNLRDLGRWLGVAAHVRAGSPGVLLSDLIDSLVVRRFRTRSDRDIVRSLWTEICSDSVTPVRELPIFTPTSLSLGLASLARDTLFCPADQTARSSSSLPPGLSPANVESVMLAVEQGWPVLLTGRSGTGKSGLISYLAAASGAEVVHVPLSSDTDAADLVGGFEQPDRSRGIFAALGSIEQRIRTGGSQALPTSMLAAVIRLRQSNLAGLDRFVRKWGNRLTTEELSGLTPPTTSTAGRFEFVDGVLLKAVESGRWIVLEDANLCPAAVLDRLNALMEPGGALAVAEGGGGGSNPDLENGMDEGVRIAKPHARFRVFLTADPRFGELSRPMRNRTVEICIDPDAESGLVAAVPTPVPGPGRISRIHELVAVLERGLVGGVSPIESAGAGALVLSKPDLKLIKPIVREVSRGLVGVDPAAVDTVLSALGQIVPEDAFLVHSHHLEQPFPLDPLANVARLASGGPREVQKKQIDGSAAAIDVLLILQTVLASGMTATVAHLYSNSQQRQGGEPVVAASALVMHTPEILVAVLQPIAAGSSAGDPQMLVDLVESCREALFLWRQLIVSSQLSTGKAIARPDGDLIRMLSTSLYRLGQSTGLLDSAADGCFSFIDFSDEHKVEKRNGLFMTEFWQTFRPAVPAKESALIGLIEAERKAGELDEIIAARIGNVAGWDRLVGVRKGMTRALAACLADEDADVAGIVTIVDTALTELSSQSTSASASLGPAEESDDVDMDDQLPAASREILAALEASPTPVFCNLWDGLARLASLRTAVGFPSVGQVETIKMLAGQPIRKSVTELQFSQSVSPASVLASVLGQTFPLISGSQLAISALVAVPAVRLTPLANLPLARAERTLLSSLAQQSELFTGSSRSLFDGFLARLVGAVEAVLTTSSAHDRLCLVPPSEGFLLAQREMADHIQAHFLAPVNGYLAGDGQIKAGHAWILLGLAAIALFLPDQPTDPAAEGTVAKAYGEDTKAWVAERVETVKCCFPYLVNQDVSNDDKSENRRLEGYSRLVRMIETRFESGKTAVRVARPTESRMANLWSEIDRLKTEISKVEAAIGLSGQAVDLDPVMASNLATLTDRLGDRYRGYDDLVGVLAGWVAVVRVGVELCQEDSQPDLNPTSLSNGPSLADLVTREIGLTPLLSPPARQVIDTQLDFESAPGAVLMQVLRRAVFWQAVGAKDHSCSTMTTLDPIFSTLHGRWKAVLDKDRQEEFERGKWFSYASRDDDEPAETEDGDEDGDIYSLQTGIDIETTDGQTEVGRTVKSDVWMAELAKLHRQIFNPPEPTTALDGTLGGVLNLVEQITGSKNQQEDDQIGRFTAPNLDRPIHFLLCRSLADPTRTGDEPAEPNFYLTPNPTAGLRLVELAGRIIHHFARLARLYPEQATLHAVIEAASKVSQVGSDVPLNSLVTVAEEIYVRMAEWETVTARIYSASGLIAALVELIIDWRREEVRAWPGLFAFEEKKASDGVARWWMVVWEAVVAAMSTSEGVASTEGDDPFRALAATLDRFLRDSPAGEFRSRLDLVGQFKSHVDTFVKPLENGSQTGHVLANIVAYFSLFLEQADKAIASGRRKWEDQVDQVVALARWKDTNVLALKQSAKTSKGKLGRVVKGWRKVLAGPVSGVDQFGSIDDQVELVVRLARDGGIGAADGNFAVAADRLAGWKSRPARFQHVATTVGRIASLSQIGPLASPDETDEDNLVGTESSILRSFLSSTLASAAALRKETSKLGHEDKNALAALKQQKQALFATVTRRLRRAGVSENLATAARIRITGAGLLGRTKAMPDWVSSAQSAVAVSNTAALDPPFFQLLSLLPKVREAGRTHSADLLHSDASRAAGLVDGLTWLIVAGRDDLIEQLNGLAGLANSVSNLAEIGTPAKPTGCGRVGSDTADRRNKAVLVRLRVLRAMVGCVPAGALGWTARLAGLEAEWMASPSADLVVRIESVFADLRQADGMASVASWANLSMDDLDVDDTQDEGGETDERLVANLIDALDGALAGIQASSAHLESLSTSTDNKGWLSSAVTSLGAGCTALQVGSVTRRLDRLIPQLRLRGDTFGPILQTIQPVLGAYLDAAVRIINRFAGCVAALTRLSASFSTLFVRLADEGFCAPPDQEGESTGQGKIETGTGLGDGVGATDVSKDVDQDELDPDTLPDEKDDGGPDKDDIESEDDAISLDGDAEMPEGTEEQADPDSDESGDEQDGDDEMEEGVGDVDGGLDEKMWDDPTPAGQEEKKSEKKEGAEGKTQDELAAASDDEDGEDDGEGEVGADVASLDGQDEDGEGEEDRTKKEDVLDLPDELDFGEADKGSDDDDDDEPGEMDGDEKDNESESESKSKPETELEKPETQSEDKTDKTGDEDETKPEDDGPEDDGPEDDGPDADGRADEGDDQVDDDDEGAGGDAMEVDSDPDAAPEPTPEDVPKDTLDDGSKEDSDDAKDYQDDANDDQDENDKDGDGDKDESTETAVEEPGGDSGRTAGSDAVDEHVDVDMDDQDREKTDAAMDNSTESQMQQQSADGADSGTGSVPGQAGEMRRDQTSGGDVDQDRDEGGEDQKNEPEVDDAVRRLGDQLEQWYRQRVSRPETESETRPDGPKESEDEKKADDMLDARFEHVDDEADADAQALDGGDKPAGGDGEGEGGAEDESREKDSRDGEGGTGGLDDDAVMDGQDQPANSESDVESDESDPESESEELVDSKDDDVVELSTGSESQIRLLSTLLAEQLRLILAPTVAAKLRGDFRTGKRLHMKRIIPFIASSYKRDKIWLRRSQPSKRDYQVVVAVDDSKSMREKGAAKVAIEAVSILGRAMALIEVGQLSVVRFGSSVDVVHPFSVPFTGQAEKKIGSAFRFEDDQTDVVGLMKQSIGLLRDSGRGRSGTWQLIVVVSDGMCENHDRVRRLVRTAEDDRVMVLMVIVDPDDQSNQSRPSTSQSSGILALRSATFDTDGTGAPKVVWNRYFDSFPFKWYVFVRDVADLPFVLSASLRQWLSEVAETG